MSGAGNKRVALITGAGQGIGEGIARTLGQAAYLVVLTDVDEQLVSETAAGHRGLTIDATGLRLDVTKASDWAEAVATVESTWGGLDVLVNNAGISSRGSIESTDEALWDQTIDVNLKGAWLGIKAALPL